MKKSLLTILLLVPAFIFAQPLISFDTVAKGLSSPVDVVEVNDSSHRLFVVEKTGTIRIFDGSALLPSAFLDVSSLISTTGERGLLSLAFHPSYLSNGYFYIYYTNTSGAITVARYSRSTANTADPASGVVLLTIEKPFANHNGGNLKFGPDGYLYFGTGDGGSRDDPDNNAQNGASLLGKMLRIDVNNLNPPYYSIPPTNPYVNSTEVKKEIIAMGLRNPWRWSFDRQTGDMWIADVGQDAWEEVNMVPAANILDKNYGWPCFEGTHEYKECTAPNAILPVFEYPHSAFTGGYSVTGGYVYRGSEFPSLEGYYLFADFSTANGWLTKADSRGSWSTTMQTGWAESLTSFGETANGALYATSLNGTLFKINASTSLPVRLVSFAGAEVSGKFKLNWQVQYEEPGDVYVVEKRTKLNEPFTEINRTTSTNNEIANNYLIFAPLTQEKSYYRLKVISVNGQIHYSNVIIYNGNGTSAFKTYINGKNLRVTLPSGTSSLVLTDAVGRTLSNQKINPTATQVTIPLTNVARGIITVRIFADSEWQTRKVFY